MRCFFMFVTAVCALFLLKPKWPKNKSFYAKSFLGEFYRTIVASAEHPIIATWPGEISTEGGITASI